MSNNVRGYSWPRSSWQKDTIENEGEEKRQCEQCVFRICTYMIHTHTHTYYFVDLKVCILESRRRSPLKKCFFSANSSDSTPRIGSTPLLLCVPIQCRVYLLLLYQDTLELRLRGQINMTHTGPSRKKTSIIKVTDIEIQTR